MIKNFRCSDTESLFNRNRVRKSVNFERVALRKLVQLNAAAELSDLAIPRGSKLESLKGKRKRQYSIRISDQYRICFEFRGGDAHNVEIVDYY